MLMETTEGVEPSLRGGVHSGAAAKPLSALFLSTIPNLEKYHLGPTPGHLTYPVTATGRKRYRCLPRAARLKSREYSSRASTVENFQ